MRHAGLGESQAGFKIAVRNISNIRYADDTSGKNLFVRRAGVMTKPGNGLLLEKYVCSHLL